MELNHLSSGYEPDEIPFLYSALTPGEPGFEPGQTESKSGVLPLDDSPMYGNCNCWGRDSNPQAIRHTHLKRTCIPVPSPQHIPCCEWNIIIFHKKSNWNEKNLALAFKVVFYNLESVFLICLFFTHGKNYNFRCKEMINSFDWWKTF